MDGLDNRRPIASRSAGWAQWSAARLARAGASANAVSAASMVAAALAGLAFWIALPMEAAGPRAALLVAGAVLCQLRLLANLLDGLVAVEHGRGTPTGPIWNELPDRISDALILVGAGLGVAAAGYPEALGWGAALAAVLVAYVRELGRGLGAPADFSGPFAKQQRMAAVTLAALVSTAEPLWQGRGEAMAVALAIVLAGSLLTAARRTARLAAFLRSR